MACFKVLSIYLLEEQRKVTKPTGCLTDTATGQLTGTVHSVSLQQSSLFEIVSQQNISCGVGWQFVTDVSSQHVGPLMSVTTDLCCTMLHDDVCVTTGV